MDAVTKLALTATRAMNLWAHAISQVRLFNAHPTGAMNKEVRLSAIMAPTASLHAAMRKIASASALKTSLLLLQLRT